MSEKAIAESIEHLEKGLPAELFGERWLKQADYALAQKRPDVDLSKYKPTFDGSHITNELLKQISHWTTISKGVIFIKQKTELKDNKENKLFIQIAAYLKRGGCTCEKQAYKISNNQVCWFSVTEIALYWIHI